MSNLVQSTLDSVYKPVREIRYRYRKEAIAFENLLLSWRYTVTFLFFPVFIMVVDFLISSNLQENFQYIDDVSSVIGLIPSLLWIRVGFLAVITGLFSYKFMDIQKNGKLGYWLALGIERREFILYAIFYSSVLISFSTFQIYFLSSLLTAISISAWVLLRIFVISFFFYFFLINVTILLTDLVENVEVSIFLITFTYFIGAYFSPETSFVRKIFVPDFLDNTLTSLFIVLGFVVGSIVLFWLNIKSFQSKNIELGG